MSAEVTQEEIEAVCENRSEKDGETAVQELRLSRKNISDRIMEALVDGSPDPNFLLQLQYAILEVCNKHLEKRDAHR